MKNETLFAIQPSGRAPICRRVAAKHMPRRRAHEHERRAAAVTPRVELSAAEAVASGAVEQAQTAEADPFHETCSNVTTMKRSKPVQNINSAATCGERSNGMIT